MSNFGIILERRCLKKEIRLVRKKEIALIPGHLSIYLGSIVFYLIIPYYKATVIIPESRNYWLYWYKPPLQNLWLSPKKIKLYLQAIFITMALNLITFIAYLLPWRIICQLPLQIIWRFKVIFATVTVGLFWIAWWQAFGSMPVASSIQVTEEWIYVLPWQLFRLWDMLIVLLVFGLAVNIIKIQLLETKDDDSAATLISGLAYGFVYFFLCGLTIGHGLELVPVIIVGLTASLVSCILIGAPLGFSKGLHVAIGLSLGASIGLGLSLGLLAGLVTLLIFVLLCVINVWTYIPDRDDLCTILGQYYRSRDSDPFGQFHG